MRISVSVAYKGARKTNESYAGLHVELRKTAVEVPGNYHCFITPIGGLHHNSSQMKCLDTLYKIESISAVVPHPVLTAMCIVLQCC